MRRKKEEKFITFREQARNEYVKDAFTSILVVSCFMFLSIPVFEFLPSKLIPDGGNEFLVSLKILFSQLYSGVGVLTPFLMYNVIKYKESGRFFTKDRISAPPLYFGLGILATLGISVSFNGLGAAIVNALRNSKFIVTEVPPLTGDTPLTYAVFLLSVTLIPTFFREFAFRGIVVDRAKKDSYAIAVVLSGLLNGFCVRSLQQIPYFLVLGILFGWMRLKTDSSLLTYVASASSNLFMASLFLFRREMPDLYDKYFPVVAVSGGAIAVIAVTVLFVRSGIKADRRPEDGKGMTKKESASAFFKSFALWLFILFAIIFIMIGKARQPYIQKEKEPVKTEDSSEASELPETVGDENVLR